MRFVPLFILALIIASCGSKSMVKSPKRQKTPSQMVMTHEEKIDVNYDQRETRKVIEENARKKRLNQKKTEKNRQKQMAQLNEANNNTSKVKRKKTPEAFNFY